MEACPPRASSFEPPATKNCWRARRRRWVATRRRLSERGNWLESKLILLIACDLLFRVLRLYLFLHLDNGGSISRLRVPGVADRKARGLEGRHKTIERYWCGLSGGPIAICVHAFAERRNFRSRSVARPYPNAGLLQVSGVSEFILLLLIISGIGFKLIELKDRTVLFALSLSLVAFVVFNQQY